MSSEETTPRSKAAILRRAVVVAVLVFFFGLGLFVGLVILFAKLANKGGGPTGVN